MRLIFCCGLLALLACGPGSPMASAAPDQQNLLETIAKTADGRVGFYAELLETKESIGLSANEHFPMQSVYKLPIAMAALHRVDEGGLEMQQQVEVTTNDLVAQTQHSPIRDKWPAGTQMSVSNLLYYMVSESDGTACDVLLRLLGGPTVANDYLQTLGVTNVIIATTEKEMGQDDMVQYRNWTTPVGIAQLLQTLQEGRGLSAASRETLLHLLTITTTGPHRIKGLLPAGTPIAHKTGSSRTVNGLTRTTNDAGLVLLPDGRHLVIAVLISDSTVDDGTRDAVIAKLSRAAWDYWVKPSGTPVRN